MIRKYQRLSSYSVDLLRDLIESGNYTIEYVCCELNLVKRQVYYLARKHGLRVKFVIDRSWMKSDEFRLTISRANKGKTRTEKQRENYRIAASRRTVKNNRPLEWHHSSETREKIRASNLRTYATLPQKWIESCLDNEEWYEKLRTAERPQRSTEHNRKIVETKVGMSYDDWLIVRGELQTYKSAVRSITNVQPIESMQHYADRGQDYHLDHRFSIAEGFRHRVPPEVIGNIVNLEFIPAIDNLRKNKQCSITLEALYEAFNGK